MDKLRLRIYDGAALAALLMLPALFSTDLSKLAELNGAASWIALLAAFVLMLCLFLLTASLTRGFENRDIITVTADVAGRPLSILYGAALTVYFSYFAGTHIRESAEILRLYGLELTPTLVLAGLILLTAVIMNLFGARAIVKSAGLFLIVTLSGVVFITLLGLNRYNPDNLVPLLGNGVRDIAQNGLFSASLFDSAIILLLLAPAFKDAGEMRKSGAAAIALAAGAYVLVSLCFIMMFSPAVAAEMTSGFIEMGKSSYYNHFFYRFESLLLFYLIISSAMLASIALFIAGESARLVLRKPASRIPAASCAAGAMLVAALPSGMLDLNEKYLPLVRRYSVFFMAGFPLVILLAGAVKRRLTHEKN